MFSFPLFTFSYSVFLASAAICYGLIRSGFRGKSIFFAFFPALLLYLGSIATALSFLKSLTGISFLIAQGIFIFFILLDVILHNIHFPPLHAWPFIHWASGRLKLSRPPLATACLTLTVIILLVSFLLRAASPVTEYDDKMYRASTPLYWIQNQSIFRFETVNERNNIFAQGASLLYLWPNLFNTGDQIANIFYWLALPLSVVGIYLFTGLFTTSAKIRAVTVLLFASTPIVVRYFTFTLVQESWLGLLLLSFLYFLLSDVRRPRLLPHVSFTTGLSLGALFFLKPTALIYLLAPVVLFTVKTDKIARFAWTLAGLITFIVLSGYGLLTSQNISLYGNAFGSAAFQQLHMTYPSLRQVLTHLIRFPFALLEFPVFIPTVAAILEQWLQQGAVFLGATAELYEETQKVWLGVYRYQLTTPNTRFGLGGVLWLFLFLVHGVQLFRMRTVSAEKRHDYAVYTVLLITVVIQIVQIRWAELSGTPYRHLLSYFVAITAFFPLYLAKVYRRVGKLPAALLMLVLLAAGCQFVFIHLGQLHAIWGGSPRNYTEGRILTQTSPYSAFLQNLKRPTTILLVGVENTLDYPLFANDRQNRNTVYRMHNADALPDDAFFKKLDMFIQANNVEYIVLYNQPEALIRAVQTKPHTYILRHEIQAADDVGFFIFQNAVFRRN